MDVKKGTLLTVRHSRKGIFKGIALEDFNTKKEEFYPIAVAQKKSIPGTSILVQWVEGEKIPCQGELCTVEKIKQE